ncbi:coiled-coil domain-containing protein 185 [Pseudophryne corroboree]|uniref:coiled-coil domain-containing protein 185 n=1 Tax=Pseudophryne corroboree TaxID=495146 RepID=UPI003081955E
MEDGRQSPSLHLDLSNFQECAGSRYVLTSPRSLEACARLGVRPVDLLHKSYAEVREENKGAGGLEVSDLYEAQERQRLRKLRLCRELRHQMLENDYKMPRSTLSDPQRGRPLPTTNASLRWAPQNSTGKSHRSGGETLRKSLSHGDLLRPEVEVNRLARKVERDLGLSVPDKDKKIAALMLLKHQEEEMSKQRMLQAEQAWEELRSKERALRAAMGKSSSMDKLQNRRRKPVSSKQNSVHHMPIQKSKRWNALGQEQKTVPNGGLVKARCDIDSKDRFQEAMDINTGETSSYPLEERMMQAITAKMVKDFQNKKNIQVKNEYEKLRHSRLKEEVDSQVRAEERSKRMTIQQKEQRFQELYEQIVEERSKELQERATREEELTLMAKIRAEQQEKEQMKHKKVLLQLTDQKMKQAKDSLGKSIQSKAEKTKELNFIKDRAHRLLMQKIQQEEDSHRREVAHLIRIKDRKSDQLLKEKEATIEQGRRVAQASFHIRDKIREQTKSRTFDQMALQAQLNASLMKSLP